MMNFRSHPNMTKCVIPDGVNLSNTDFSNAFNNMRNIVSVNLSDKIVNLSNAFYWCKALSTPMCPKNCTNMYETYSGCTNLTGNPVCGDNVTNMMSTYDGCRNLTGSPVCGDNVTDMYEVYDNCQNLTGSPVCGDKVINMDISY